MEVLRAYAHIRIRLDIRSRFWDSHLLLNSPPSLSLGFPPLGFESSHSHTPLYTHGCQSFNEKDTLFFKPHQFFALRKRREEKVERHGYVSWAKAIRYTRIGTSTKAEVDLNGCSGGGRLRCVYGREKMKERRTKCLWKRKWKRELEMTVDPAI